MLQVVFGDSEKGAIVCALNFSNSIGGAHTIGVINSDGREPTQEERDSALAQFRHQWEQERLRGKPLGGNRADVIGITAALDIGDIDCPLIGDTRRELTHRILSADPWNELSEMDESIKLYWDGCVADYETLIKRAKAGEPVRIWYGSAPYSLCGFNSVLYELRDCDCRVTAVRLPVCEQTEYGIKSAIGWGEISPGDWAGYLTLETEISKPARVALAEVWEKLKRENAPVRALVNGRLHSVNIDFYDDFIRREMPNGTVKVAQLIGNVLGKHQLGIGDWFIARRIQTMIETGELRASHEDTGFYNWSIEKG